MPSSINKQSVDTTLPKAIYKWVITRDKMLKIMEAGDDSPLPAEKNEDGVELATTKLGRLPQLVKDLRDAENKIYDVKRRIKDGNIADGETAYVEEMFNDFVAGKDNRRASKTAGSKKKLPFLKEDGEPFTSQDITDAMRGGTLESGFLSNRLSNKDSKEFKSILVELTLSDSKTADTRETQTVEYLRNPTDTTKKKEAEEKADATGEELLKKEQAQEQLEKDKREQKQEKKQKKKEKSKLKDKLREEKEKLKETEGLTITDPDDPPNLRGGIGGEEEKEGEVVQLEDVAEEEGLKGEGDTARTSGGSTEPEPTEPEPTEPAPAPSPPPMEEATTDPLPDNRGTVEELPDILDASRGGVNMTPSSIVKGADSSAKEDAQRSKMNIARLKEEIRALHLIYDNNIKKFRSNPHQGDKEDALKSDKIEVVRKHHKEMEVAVREYYRSGGGDTLQVGVIVPIDTYLQQYLSGGAPNEVSVPTRTTGKEGTTSVGLGHRDGDLTSKKHDPYSRAIAQGIYYQRGGMGSYRQKPVSGHTVKIGGKDKMGAIKDPRTRVDAVMNNFLNRALVEVPNPALKLKTR